MSEANQSDAPKPGTPEYDAAMAAKGRGGPPTDGDGDVPKIPEGGAEKFYNAETGEYNWEAHAKEQMYRAQNPQPKSPSSGLEGGEGDKSSGIASVFEKTGLSEADVAAAWRDKGALTDEQYEKFSKQGYPREMVDGYYRGLAAEAEKADNVVFAALGDNDIAKGKAAWSELAAWAKTGMSESERAAANQMLTTDPKAAVSYISGLKAARTKDQEGAILDGKGGGGGRAVGYTSKAQMKADMANPKYRSDPAFRREVADKMRNATWSDEPKY